MSDTGTSTPTSPSTDSVISFLNNQPDFLASHPQILKHQQFPNPEQGGGLLDFQDFMVKKLRDENTRFKEMIQEITDNGRDNISVQSFTLTAALAILNTVSASDFKRLLRDDLPPMLDLDITLVALEKRHPRQEDTPPSPILGSIEPVWLEPTTVNRILQDDGEFHLNDAYEDHMGVFGDANPGIQSAALIRIHAGRVLPSGLFALGSRSAATFSEKMGTELVTFLTRVVENRLYHFFEPADLSDGQSAMDK